MLSRGGLGTANPMTETARSPTRPPPCSRATKVPLRGLDPWFLPACAAPVTTVDAAAAEAEKTRFDSASAAQGIRGFWAADSAPVWAAVGSALQAQRRKAVANYTTVTGKLGSRIVFVRTAIGRLLLVGGLLRSQ